MATGTLRFEDSNGDGVRHTFRLISLPSLHDNDLKFPDAVYCSTFDGGPKHKTSNSPFLSRSLVTV